ncbi:hypothetical protein D3C86_1555960 [compost metagenome]
MQHQGIALIPVLKTEGACTTGMITKILAPFTYYLMRYHRAIRHTEYLRKRAERLVEVNKESTVIDGFEWLLAAHAVIKDPGTG